MIKITQNNKDFSIQNIKQKFSLIIRNRKIAIPKHIEIFVIDWHDKALCHPGEKYFNLYISQPSYWKNLCKTVHKSLLNVQLSSI